MDPITILNIVEGVQCKLKDFRGVKVSHVQRQGNRACLTARQSRFSQLNSIF